MKLKELSRQYRQSAELCGNRAAELDRELESTAMCEIDRLRLRRRISILRSMTRDALAVSRYLENYYGDDENAGEKA